MGVAFDWLTMSDILEGGGELLSMFERTRFSS